MYITTIELHELLKSSSETILWCDTRHGHPKRAISSGKGGVFKFHGKTDAIACYKAKQYYNRVCKLLGDIKITCAIITCQNDLFVYTNYDDAVVDAICDLWGCFDVAKVYKMQTTITTHSKYYPDDFPDINKKADFSPNDELLKELFSIFTACLSTSESVEIFSQFDKTFNTPANSLHKPLKLDFEISSKEDALAALSTLEYSRILNRLKETSFLKRAVKFNPANSFGQAKIDMSDQFSPQTNKAGIERRATTGSNAYKFNDYLKDELAYVNQGISNCEKLSRFKFTDNKLEKTLINYPLCNGRVQDNQRLRKINIEDIPNSDLSKDNPLMNNDYTRGFINQRLQHDELRLEKEKLEGFSDLKLQEADFLLESDYGTPESKLYDVDPFLDYEKSRINCTTYETGLILEDSDGEACNNLVEDDSLLKKNNSELNEADLLLENNEREAIGQLDKADLIRLNVKTCANSKLNEPDLLLEHEDEPAYKLNQTNLLFEHEESSKKLNETNLLFEHEELSKKLNDTDLLLEHEESANKFNEIDMNLKKCGEIAKKEPLIVNELQTDSNYLSFPKPYVKESNSSKLLNEKVAKKNIKISDINYTADKNDKSVKQVSSVQSPNKKIKHAELLITNQSAARKSSISKQKIENNLIESKPNLSAANVKDAKTTMIQLPPANDPNADDGMLNRLQNIENLGYLPDKTYNMDTIDSTYSSLQSMSYGANNEIYSIPPPVYRASFVNNTSARTNYEPKPVSFTPRNSSGLARNDYVNASTIHRTDILPSSNASSNLTYRNPTVSLDFDYEYSKNLKTREYQNLGLSFPSQTEKLLETPPVNRGVKPVLNFANMNNSTRGSVSPSYSDANLMPGNACHTSSTSSRPTIPNKTNGLDIYETPLPRGLINYGETCFFNALFQCLATLPGFVINVAKFTSSLLRMNQAGEHVKMCDHSISFLLNQYFVAAYIKRVPSADSRIYEIVITLLNKLGFDEGQQDSHELYINLMGELYSEELLVSSFIKTSMISDFSIEFKVTYCCIHCPKVMETVDKSNFISITPGCKEADIRSLCELSLSKEYISDTKCSDCGKMGFYKVTEITKESKYLVIHINRFNAHSSSKNNIHVFLNEEMHISKCINKPSLYSFMSAVYHSGETVNSGHFISLFGKGDNMIFFSDERAYKSLKDINWHNPLAYLVFYMKA